MKPTITLKRDYDNGEVQTVEVFKYEKGLVLHRHLITKDEKKAKLYGIFRVFWNTFYCMQEIVLMNDEIVKIADLLCQVQENKPTEVPDRSNV